MKKGFIFYIFLFGSVFVNAQANSGPIIGYDKLQWGASIQVFQQTYPSAREVSSDLSSIGVREFQQENIGSGIDRRMFNFFNGKLYQVAVLYEAMDLNSMYALVEKIVSIYGKFDDNDDTTTSSNGINSRAYRFYRYFNSNLTIMVVVAEAYNSYNYSIGSTVICFYYNPSIREEVDAANRKKQRDNFGL
jgi:hypothetical protein